MFAAGFRADALDDSDKVLSARRKFLGRSATQGRAIFTACPAY